MKRKIVASILIAVGIFVNLFSLSVSASPVQKEVMGVIRNTGTGWVQIGGAHKSINILRIDTVNIDNPTDKNYNPNRLDPDPEDDVIRVYYTFVADYVLTSSFTVDETMAAEDYRIGASVGLSSADIFIYKDGSKNEIDPNTYISAGGNIWIWVKLEDN